MDVEQTFTVKFTVPSGWTLFTATDVEVAIRDCAFPNLYRDGAFTIEVTEEK